MVRLPVTCPRSTQPCGVMLCVMAEASEEDSTRPEKVSSPTLTALGVEDTSVSPMSLFMSEGMGISGNLL